LNFNREINIENKVIIPILIKLKFKKSIQKMRFMS